MNPAFQYDDLSQEAVDAAFSEQRALAVQLSPARAGALITYIEQVRLTKNWEAKRTNLISRLPGLVKFWFVLARLATVHSRLLELSKTVIVTSTSQSWEELADGQFLFRFER